jgi:hypothetical protein
MSAIAKNALFVLGFGVMAVALVAQNPPAPLSALAPRKYRQRLAQRRPLI